jgi:hypothetical protein
MSPCHDQMAFAALVGAAVGGILTIIGMVLNAR